jgi:drug/metabolite transporter (DMT)-like permease
MKKGLGKAYIALGLVSFLWGTTYIATRVGVQEMPGIFLSGLRQFTAGFIVVAFFLVRGYKLPDLASLKHISIQGIFLLCIANGGLTWALEYISGGLAAIIAALLPLFITVFSILILKSGKITKWMLAGMIIGFGGIVIIFYDYLDFFSNKGFAFGVALAVMSTLSWAFGMVYTSKKKLPVDILFSVGLQMLIAGVITLFVCLLSGKYVNLANTGSASLYSLLYLILFGSLIAYSAFVFAVSKLPPTLVSIYAYINPIVAVLLGWMLLHEKLNPNMILGTVVTLGGVYLVNREFKKQRT